jgi:maleate isomerase
MGDVLGWRRKFGAIGPSTNTVVQPDYDAMRPTGVTNHYSRIFTPNAKLTNETFRAGVTVINDNVMDAVKSVMTCQPDYLVMAMSAITFFGGAKGADAFMRNIEEFTGLALASVAIRPLKYFADTAPSNASRSCPPIGPS